MDTTQYQNRAAVLNKLQQTYQIASLDLSAVNLEISTDDNMFVEGFDDHYFNVGFSGLINILTSLACAQKDKHDVKSILDFPSGWGRELRFIKVYFPEADITAGEIDERSLTFCREQFKVNTFLSQTDLSKISVKNKFDLIWCGSLFTHLSKFRFKQLLDFFYHSLNDDGVLCFTAHGRYARHLLDSREFTYGLNKWQITKLLLQHKITDYGYVNYRGAIDYGISLTRPSWIMRSLEVNDQLRVVSYKEKGYDNHQDVITCIKQAISGKVSTATRHEANKRAEETQQPVNGCAATLSDAWELHIPILKYAPSIGPSLYLWADFERIQSPDASIWLRVIQYEEGKHLLPESNCRISTLSADLKLYVPEVIFGGVSYWCNACHTPHSTDIPLELGMQFKVMDYGINGR